MLIDVKDEPKGPTKNQYEGSRSSTNDGVLLTLSCMNPPVKDVFDQVIASGLRVHDRVRSSARLSPTPA